jgi:hypothetical protein
MTDPEWRALVQAGGQTTHQARELLRRPLSAWEGGTWQEIWRAWALAVLALDPNGPHDQG